MRSKFGVTLMTIGAMLVTAALSLAVYNIYTDKEAEKKSSDILVILEEKITQKSLENTETFNTEITKVEAQPIKVENNDYIGIVYIPAINIKLPVLSEWSYDNLKIAPCRYNGNVADGEFIIAAHNYTAHFGKLKNLVCDDEVYFIDSSGEVYSFYVCDIESVNGSDPDRMLEGNWPLTLFTCNFDGTERVTIRCEKKIN